MIQDTQVQNSRLELVSASASCSRRDGEEQSYDHEALAAAAAESAHSLILTPGTKRSRHFAQRVRKLHARLQRAFASAPPQEGERSEDERWFYDNYSLLRSTDEELREAEDALARITHVRRRNGDPMPRAIAIAEDLLQFLEYRFTEAAFSAYLRAFQNVAVLNLNELWAMALALKLVLLERIVEAALPSPLRANETKEGVATCIRSLSEIRETPWDELLEPLVVFDEILRRDPAGAYARMDAESREMYRRTVEHIAKHSDFSEVEVAEMALSLARDSLRYPEPDPRLATRRSHVGYYLIAEGREALHRQAQVHLPIHDRLESLLRRYPDEFYLSGVELLTLVIAVAILWRGVELYSLSSALFTALVLLLPCSLGAVEVMNYLTTSLLRPQILPKLEFPDGIPDDCLTMVVVPCLLLNEKQVRRLVSDLEVRYVGNAGPNLHFALLTDLADSAEQPREDDALVELCGELIRGLNQKYAGNGAGKFAMFHRHRVYNRREGVWMGWERKRGKLLDFSKLIAGSYDSFPYKVGDLSVLPRVRYVLTVDADTELPRGTAQRLVGTIAHPLCQAIIDPRRNIVVEGFGILQPRVGVSVQSAAQSRLASLYSGQTGFDIYTRAVSDVYQDLYGEGTFTGKGLYEVRTLLEVLDHRFPRNALLSHDLIEGAYSRAALVSDVEVVDHYPSHYSAYTRRKHRWLRGDWQIVEWLFSRVPDESGRRIPNPISLISQWKILDNLRRSMVEPATFLLLLLGWTVLPGSPLYWTLVTLAILFVPPWVQFAVRALRAVFARNLRALGDACGSLGTAQVTVLLALTFLVHNTLVATDAIWRALYRRLISRRRLLEWETAAEAELNTHKRTPLDLYLNWTPAIAAIVGAALFLVRRSALWPALPILFLWAGNKLIALWLDRRPRSVRQEVPKKDLLFLRAAALRTWRYFAEFSTQQHNWLIPDSVQEDPPNLAPRISPTNLGLLLNARQAACELGYLTVPEFAEQTRHTLDAMTRLRQYRGHLLNWYDTRTLSPLAPLFVSTVDSGNLAAALLTLKNGCAALLEKPLLSAALVEGYEDYVHALADLRLLPRRVIRSWRKRESLPWLKRLLAVNCDLPIDETRAADRTRAADARWLATEFRMRTRWAQKLVSEYMPWLMPQFDSLRKDPSIGINATEHILLADLPAYIQGLQARVQKALENPESDAQRENCESLSAHLADAHARAVRLVQDLRLIAAQAEHWVAKMEFGFLLNSRRKLLSIGYDLEAAKLHPACYDLLASESRIATFVAIAKGDISQQVWFRLGRTHVPARPRPTLISWTGTMFEYLMPAIWMRSYRTTVLQRSMEGAVREQQAYAAGNRVPWGISESAYCDRDEAGVYQYGPFGVPQLALQDGESRRLVVAPYAAMLALSVDAVAAIGNLQRLAGHGWRGAYGFYEAAELTPAARSYRRRRFEVVRAWMAHHQGMSLLSLANFLCGDVVQEWFHRDTRVKATDLLLQERPVLHDVRPARKLRRPVLPSRTPAAAAEKLLLAS